MLYKNGKYDEAINQYEKALQDNNIPEERECKVRINYALAICKTVQVDESDEQSIRNAIKQYESAIDVLTEKGCAHKDDDNGHSKDAQQLKNDIQKEIDRLKRLLDSSSNSGSDNDENDENNENNNANNNQNETEEERKEREKLEEIEKKIDEIKQDATEEQREKEKKYEDLNNYSFNKPEKNW